jgi:hypothetical protein
MMRSRLSHTLPAVLLLAFASLPAQASAEPATLTLEELDAERGTGSDAAAEDIDSLLANESVEPTALPAGELAATNGLGVDIDAEIDNSINGSVVSTQELTATTTDNDIGGDVLSGNVNFSDHALQGFSGIGNFAINTGAQSNIQSSISISVMTVAP